MMLVLPSVGGLPRIAPDDLPNAERGNDDSIDDPVTVADHEGRAVHNFRYGPVSFIDGGACPKATGGCPVIATNGVKIEYGGKMDLPGKPFQVSGANVP